MNMPVLKPIPFPKGLSYFRTLVSYTRLWRVVEDYILEIPNHPRITIPEGFIFDGASVPKIFRNLVSPTGILLIPGLVHDFGYRYNYLLTHYSRYMEGAGKDIFDELFLEIANHVNGLKAINEIAYFAVKYGGGKAWKRHINAQVDNK